MNTITLLSRQTADAYQWAGKLIRSVPHDRWDTIPPVMETSITWQAGHLIMSYYYHTVMVITGHQKEVFDMVPLKEYDQYFTRAGAAAAAGKTAPATLLDQLAFMEQRSLHVIATLRPADLDSALVPGKFPHPVAATKFEALDWNIKHTMWHCGQIAILKRVVDKRYDFGF